MPNIYLFTTYYREANDVRKNEILYCLNANCKNKKIDIVITLNESHESTDLLFSLKINEIKISSRPTYSQFFEIINKFSTNDDINVIANSDIYFNENIGLLKYINLKGKCLALSRWDVQPGGSAKLFNRNDSQDVWIFKGKVKEGVFGDFPVGVPFCDNRIMYELQKAGYEVLNPAYSIKAYHLHAGKREEYVKEKLTLFVDPPYRYLYPHNFYSLPRTLWFNLTHKCKLAPYRYDLKKLNRWFIIKVVRRIWEVTTGKEFPLIGYNR